MFQLPTTRPGRRYRGKYPDAIRMLGYSNSFAQQVIGGFLSINRPIHIEINDGRRYIAAADEINMDKAKPGEHLGSILKTPVADIEQLSQERYDEMIAVVRKARSRRI